MLVVSLRGRIKGTEHIMIDVLVDARHQFGWKGWLVEDRMNPVKNGYPLLWLAIDWVEYAYIEMAGN